LRYSIIFDYRFPLPLLLPTNLNRFLLNTTLGIIKFASPVMVLHNLISLQNNTFEKKIFLCIIVKPNLIIKKTVQNLKLF